MAAATSNPALALQALFTNLFATNYSDRIVMLMGQPEPHLRAAQNDKALCQELLKKEQPLPKDSMFNDDLFELRTVSSWGKTPQALDRDRR